MSQVTVHLTTSPPPASMAGPSTMVTCKLHGRQRMAKYCLPRPVKNADGDIIKYVYQCQADSECNTATTGTGRPQDDTANASSPVTVTGDVSAKAAAPTSVARVYTQAAAAGRYYDLSKFTGGIESSQKKVCFSCGQQDHERPQCMNQLCRACHQSFGSQLVAAPHRCPELPVSPFVGIPEPFTAAQLKNVRCALCHQIGHLDCAGLSNPDSFEPTCAYCGQSGHHAFSCPHAPRDRWIAYQEQVAQRPSQLRRAAPGTQTPPVGTSVHIGRRQDPSAPSSSHDSGRRRERSLSPPRDRGYRPQYAAERKDFGSSGRRYES